MEKKNWVKTYLFIWAGQFVSLLTSSAVNFAVVIWLSIEFKSAEILAYSAIAALLPQAIIGPFAGVYIDRWNRKKVMIFADAFIAFCTFLMTFVLREGAIHLELVYLIMALRSVGSAFHSPAMQAIAPLLVPEDQLLRVSGVNQMLQSISQIAGPAMGALAIASFPINKVLYLDIIGAILAITSLLFVSIPHVKTKVSGSIQQVWRDLNLGFLAIHQNKGLNRMFLYSMLATVGIMPVAIMFPLLTIDHFKGAEFEMSVVEIVWGVGMLVGGSLLSAFKVEIRKVIMVNTMHMLLGFTFVVSGILSPNLFIVFAVLTGLGGMAMSIFSASFMTIIQEEIAPDMLGRVFSLYFSFAILPSLIGLLFAGNIADNIGVANAFIIAGILCFLIGVASFLTPSLMAIGKNKPQNKI